ncbi:MAG: UDP-2,3-diacylglucosamine diphosphatase [Saprospirales bacterium]|nr:MAG: UDP-2,3-diacylglucosamine diphosphatase [Saprospirales bacterium]
MDGKIYFASDFHLGLDAEALTNRQRERIICRWLDTIARDASEIYLVGDLFDFWFEYQTVIPKGHTRFLGKLAELSDSGIDISVFSGNHDMWMFGYFEEELGIPVFHKQVVREWNGKRFFIGHGDGLGPGDRGYKRLKKVFRNRLCQWLFARLHPNFGITLANFWSGKSRAHSKRDEFLGADREWLVQYCERKLTEDPTINYFVFGHRHLPIQHTLENGKSVYINLGDWIHHFTYAVFDGEKMELKKFEPQVIPASSGQETK